MLLSDQDVQAIVVSPGATDAVVFVGLSHMGFERGQAIFERGQAIRIARSESDGRWRVTATHDLLGTPSAYVTDADAMLVATTRSLERLPPSGEPAVLFDTDPLRLGAPLSLAVATTGEIAVGMRHCAGH